MNAIFMTGVCQEQLMRMVMIAALGMIAKAVPNAGRLRLAIITGRRAVFLTMQSLSELISCAILHC
jgi:hypothetical protein